ncbi:MAG: DUF1580 domain-containing protein [Phycisphaerae bacterium]
MPDLHAERRLSVTTAAREVFDVSPETAWRWALRGVRGVKLESHVVGGRRFTTREACDRFLARLNGSPTPPGQLPPTNGRAAAASRKLDDLGI